MGVYDQMRTCMQTKISMYENGVFTTVDPMSLPSKMEVEVMIDVGENSNKNKLQKLAVFLGIRFFLS